ncbi:MAG: hypothetical protein K0V04_29465 [Deltaproteobacteria bacterium]|nr:hypothetical protein [Deltaproteobacteria bacterium]
MAHRVFRGFPSRDDLAERIDTFVARLQHSRYRTALVLCPVTSLDTAFADDDEVADELHRRCTADAQALAMRLGKVKRDVDVQPRHDAHHGDAYAVVARYACGGIGRFTLASTNDDDRWTLWLESFSLEARDP